MTQALPAPDRLALIEHRAWVRALARRLLSDENDVDDVEQETWAAALTKSPDEPRATRTWLGVVASRFALQRRRGDARRTARETASARPEAGGRPAAEVVAEADAHRHVVDAVFALDEPYRTTVLLRYFEGLEIAAVARRMNVPLETVRTRLRRAHEKLRGALESEHRAALAVVLAPLGAASRGAAASTAAAGTASSSAKAAVFAGAALAVALVGATLLKFADGGADPARGGPVAATAPQEEGAAGRSAPSDAPPSAESKTRDAIPTRPPERSMTAAASAPAAPRADAWTAYDLADGKPLADFALHVRTSAGETDVRTDASGAAPVDRADVLDVTPAAPWTFARPTSGAAKDEPSLWFRRDRAVAGRVRPENGEKTFAFAAVNLSWTLPFDVSEKTDEPGRGARWLGGHGCWTGRAERPAVRVGLDGRLEGAASAVRGATLVAEADGWAAATAPLAWTTDETCVVDLVLRNTVRVVGRVLDESGAAVAGKRVELSTAVAVAGVAEAMRLQAMRVNGGFAYGERDGKGVVVFIDQATTDVRGIFRFDAAALGEGVVSLFEPGFAVCRQEIGRLDCDPPAFEMRLARSDASVVVLAAGAPVASAPLMLQVADGRENGFSVRTDADGRAPAAWLQRGRWYCVSSGERLGCFRWDGQEALDFERLPKRPDEAK